MKLLKTQNLTQIRKKKIIQKKKTNTDKHRHTEFREKLEILIKNTRYKWFSDYNCFEYKNS